MRAPASGADDYRMLLTVIAGIALGVAATTLPVLIQGPYLDWLYAAKVVMWFTGIAAGVLEYLAVSFGSRLYLVRVEVFATASLALVFISQAGLFIVLQQRGPLVPHWFAVFAVFCAIAGLEANHGRRMVVRHGHEGFPPEVVAYYARSLRQVVALILTAGAASLLIAILASNAPAPLVFAFACAAFATVIAANIHQERTRNTLATYGVLQPAQPQPDDPRPPAAQAWSWWE